MTWPTLEELQLLAKLTRVIEGSQSKEQIECASSYLTLFYKKYPKEVPLDIPCKMLIKKKESLYK